MAAATRQPSERGAAARGCQLAGPVEALPGVCAQVCAQSPARGGGRVQPQWTPPESPAGSARRGAAPPPEPRWGRGGAGRGRRGCWLQSPRSRRPARSRPRGSSGARRRGRPEAMAAHGKLRRERGLQAEYEAQVKGERASGARPPTPGPASLPRPQGRGGAGKVPPLARGPLLLPSPNPPPATSGGA